MDRRITALLIRQLESLAEGRSVLIVAFSEAEARSRGRMLVRAARALGIPVRGRTRDLDAPAIRLRAFDEPPAGHEDVFYGMILPSAVFERGRVREAAVRSTSA